MASELLERRLTRKGHATRDRIIDAATELIARNGVAGTSTEQVRELAGVSGSQLYHYFGTKQALIRAVITRQADAAIDLGTQPQIGALDSLDALQAWADAAITRQGENDGRGECNLGTLAGELSVSDEQSRAEISHGFLRWKELLDHGLRAMRARGDLRPDADVDELAYALLAALQGGSLLSQTLRNAMPLQASMNAALAYVRSFAASAADEPGNVPGHDSAALQSALRDAPEDGAGIAELMRTTGMGRSTLYRYLSQLADEGRAVQAGWGRWRAAGS